MNAENKPGSGETRIETFSDKELVAQNIKIMAAYKEKEKAKGESKQEEEEKEKIKFEVSPDKKRGFITLDSGIPTLPTVDMVEDFILDHNVTVPIKRDDIEAAFEIYEKDPSRPKRILVAEWTEPEGTSARIEFRFLDKAEREKCLDENLETGILEQYREVASTWPAHYDDYDNFKPPSKMIYVKKGDLLATVIPGVMDPGYDIFGEEIKEDFKRDIPSDEAMEIDRGTVELREEGKKAYARISGYVTLASPGYTLKVISPILVTGDELQAYFIKFLEQPSLSKEEVQEWLDYFGIKFGIMEDNIDLITQGKIEKDCVLIAQGIPKEDGTDANLELNFEDKIKPGEIGQDGRIDFRQRVEYKTFEPGDLIAKLYSPVLGQSGIDVFGKTLFAEDGVDIMVGALVNVSHKIVEDGVEYNSEIMGRAHVKTKKTVRLSVTHQLHVQPVLSIPGSVDAETGDISFAGHVEIDGNINEGFSVNAKGNIEVSGSIFNNATVEAGGDIVITGGINGKDTRVQAGDDITTRYISGSRITAGGNIIVSNIIHHAHLESGGTIVFLGRRPKDSKAIGSIVNSRLYAVNSIKAARAGSYADKNTFLTLVPLTIEQLHELNACEDYAQENRDNVAELYSFFGQHPSPKQVTVYLEKNPEDTKVKEWLQGMSHFEKTVKPKMEELRESLEENLSGSSLLGLDDIFDWPGYCSKLVQDANQDLPNPGKKIWSLLPKEIQSLIESSATATSLSRENKSTITNALNDVLEQRDFYQEQDYSRKALPEKAKELLARDRDELPGRDLRKLNRLLIEVAYPRKIAKTNLRGYTPFINVGEMYANVTIEFKPYPPIKTFDANKITYRMNHRKRTVVSSARSSV